MTELYVEHNITPEVMAIVEQLEHELAERERGTNG